MRPPLLSAQGCAIIRQLAFPLFVEISMVGENKPPKIPETYRSLIVILKAMTDGETPSVPPRHLQIEQIAQRSGMRDEKEIQRYLYIMEGQKLVSPFPEGDFTSKTWYVTSHGMKTLKMIARSTQAAA